MSEGLKPERCRMCDRMLYVGVRSSDVTLCVGCANEEEEVGRHE